MARPVPSDLEDALAASPAARERFWSLPPEQVDAWVRYVERARLPGARRRRIGETVRRLAGRPRRGATTVETNGNAAAAVAPPRDDWFVWLLVAAVLAGLIALILWLTVFRDNGSSKPGAVVVGARATVPRVIGIRVQSAQFQLRQEKLTSTVVLLASRKKRGIVIGQAPKGGKSIPEGSSVKLLVSKGPPGVAVPSVTGLAAADAVQRLQTAKLGATLNQIPSTKAPGTVLAQRPASGQVAKPGSKVVLDVAKGKASISVPNVVGRPESSAAATLRQAGLTASAVQVPSSQPKGTVVAESPPAGQKVAQGSAVRLNVSKGSGQATTTTAPTTTQAAAPPPKPKPKPKPPTTPYSGQSLNAAVQKIAQGRQQAAVVYVASSTVPSGTVVSSATTGSRVRLNVSGGSQLAPATPVPDVTGEDKATATSDLENAGFTVVPVKWPVTDQASDGVVVAQTPATRAPQGAAIVIYVGDASG
jgi:beta-lactam-binding protein with PASTA domain